MLLKHKKQMLKLFEKQDFGKEKENQGFVELSLEQNNRAWPKQKKRKL